MAKEKWIRGKRDSAKHDGLYANTKRLQAAEWELEDWLRGNPVDRENVTCFNKHKGDDHTQTRIVSPKDEIES